MNRDTDLIQLRYGPGGQLQIRQRLIVYVPIREDVSQKQIKLGAWTDWETVPAIKGDSSDEQFE